MNAEAISDRYAIRYQIAVGGMGVVYRATDRELHREVAIKTLASDLVRDQDAKERLLEEARALANLDHPGIVRLYHTYVGPEGQLHLVMEYVEGENLADLLTRDMPRERVIAIVRALAEALDAAHARGFLHRDVKPGNVVLRPEGRPVLLDFGLSKLFLPPPGRASPFEVTRRRPSTQGGVLGTPGYMAPEQLDGRRPTPATDQFQLAVTAFEMLTGKLPFPPRTSLAIPGETTPRSWGFVDDQPELRAVFVRALSSDPEARFPSVSAFAEALESALVARPHRAPGHLGVVAGVALVAAAGLLAWQLTRHGGARREPEALRAPAGSAVSSPVSMATRDAVLACPILEVEPGRPQDRWLGAAAAQLACARAASWLGGGLGVSLGPAELLSLPRIPVDGFPEDPYGDADAASQTLDAARGRARHRLVGSVRADDDAVHVELRVDDDPRAVTASGAVVWQAVALAVDAVFDGGYPLARATSLAPSVARWFPGTPDVEALVRNQEAVWAVYSGVEAEAYCEAAADDPALTSFWRARRSHCEPWLRSAPPPSPQPPRSDVEAYSEWAGESAAQREAGQREALLEWLRERRGDHLDDPNASAVLAMREASVALVQGRRREASHLLLETLRVDPTLLYAWEVLNIASRDNAIEAETQRAFSAWFPGYPPAWCALRRTTKGAARLEALRRCVRLGPGVPVNAILLGAGLVDAGRIAEAETVAASLVTRGDRATLAGRFLEARIDARRNRLGRALERLSVALLEQPTLGGNFLFEGDGRVLAWFLELADLLPGGGEAVDALVRHFVLGRRPRIETSSYAWAPQAYGLCFFASAALAPGCVERVDAIRPEVEPNEADLAYAAGVRAWLDGDSARAAQRFREAQIAGGRRFAWPVARLEASGLGDLARRIDRDDLTRDDFGGVHPAWWREGGRLVAEGDVARGQVLLHAVRRAWADADVALPMGSAEGG